MAKPTVRVRIAFVDGPYVASPTWTDVTSYVRSITTSRGRTDDWQNFDSGSATVVLDNRDRRFDPTYTLSPYYGNLQPRRQIRIDATTDSVNYYDVFRGYVDGWPVEITNAGYDSTVTISCYDLLGLIAQTTAPYDWADAYIRSLSPIRYIKCDDVFSPANRSSFFLTDYGSYASNLTALQSAAVLQTVDSVAPGLPYKSISFGMGSNQYIQGSTPETSYSVLTATWWGMPGLVPGSSSNEIYFTFVGGSNVQYTCYGGWFYATTGSSLIMYVSTASTTRSFTVTTELTPGIGQHLGIVVDTSGATPTMRILINGTEVSATAASPAFGLSYSNAIRIGDSTQQFVMFGSDIGNTAIQNICQLGQGRVVETTAARFSRAMGQTSVPAALYSAPASPAGTVAKINNGGEPINTTIQLASDSEGGELYTSKAGVLTMTNRTYYQSGTSATSQATFGVGGIPIGVEASYYWTADGIRNALNLEWSGDTTINVSDSTSIAAYGSQQDNYSTQLSTAADTQTLGSLLVGFGKLPRLIMSAVEVGQALTAAQWVTVLGLELLDRITVVIDEQVGSDLSQTQLIQQIEHQITPGDWRTTILGSSRWSSVFTIGTSYLDGTDILG